MHFLSTSDAGKGVGGAALHTAYVADYPVAKLDRIAPIYCTLAFELAIKSNCSQLSQIRHFQRTDFKKLQKITN